MLALKYKCMRTFKLNLFKFLCWSATATCLAALVFLFWHLWHQGGKWLSLEFLTEFPSRWPSRAGIKSALYGSVWVIGLSTLISVPVGILTAVYLEEYASLRWAQLLKTNIANLAGVPSIVYGLLGLALFVRAMGLERSVLAGALTLSLLSLPIVIVSASQAIAAVPSHLRMGAYALGLRSHQVIWGQVLPAALPGLMSSLILSVSRVIGEAAPVLIVGALSYVAFVPESWRDPFTVLPVQIFNWAGRPQTEFHELACAGSLVLMALLLLSNAAAILIRHKWQNKGSY